MAVSESRMRANHKYDDKAYDKISLRLPKGSKDIILNSGETVNGFLNKAFKEYCENHGIRKDVD